MYCVVGGGWCAMCVMAMYFFVRVVYCIYYFAYATYYFTGGRLFRVRDLLLRSREIIISLTGDNWEIIISHLIISRMRLIISREGEIYVSTCPFSATVLFSCLCNFMSEYINT